MENIKKKAIIFGSIFTLSNRLQILGDKFDERLTVKQWLLLASIHNSQNKSPTISEVAAIVGNSRQNVKKMLLILERSGFVTFENDSNDARVQRIKMTEECLNYLRQRENRELEFLNRLFEGFESDEINTFLQGIMKLDKNIQRLEGLYHDEDKE
jgi:DNA-binding MarR family transcriptional regulator